MTKQIAAGLAPDITQTLRKTAKDFGFLVGRGEYSNEGSINALNEAIARDELIVARKPEVETWHQLRAEHGNDSVIVALLLDYYCQRHLPADDGCDPILGWNRVTLNQPQPCYECDQPVVGDCYQVMDKLMFAHVTCIED